MRQLAPVGRVQSPAQPPQIIVQVIDQRQANTEPVQVNRSSQGSGGMDLMSIIIPGVVQDLARRGPLAQTFERTYRLQRA